MTEATTQACAEALLSSWVSRFDVPNDITTDRGPAFLSEICLTLANLIGTTFQSTTAYNPAAYGMFERTHRALKVLLMASCIDGDWKSRLPWVLLGLWTTPRTDGEPSPAEKVYGEALAVPGEFFPTSTDDTQLDHLRDIARKFRPCLKRSDTASAGPGRSRVPPENKAANEKISKKRRREVAIHTPTADVPLRSKTRGTLRRPKRYED
ncbi:uncharacterized protein [Palaemon carinicauda]|uniref:uncharacterized protein n=1 Tax=Palaemon carinicauda TaxID=392227 RepID=UPI0035B5C5B2